MSPSEVLGSQHLQPAADANQPLLFSGDDGGAQSEQPVTAETAQAAGLQAALVDRGECLEGGFSGHE